MLYRASLIKSKFQFTGVYNEREVLTLSARDSTGVGTQIPAPLLAVLHLAGLTAGLGKLLSLSMLQFPHQEEVNWKYHLKRLCYPMKYYCGGHSRVLVFNQKKDRRVLARTTGSISTLRNDKEM